MFTFILNAECCGVVHDVIMLILLALILCIPVNANMSIKIRLGLIDELAETDRPSTCQSL